jgi:hypothetical protein
MIFLNDFTFCEELALVPGGPHSVAISKIEDALKSLEHSLHRPSVLSTYFIK